MDGRRPKTQALAATGDCSFRADNFCAVCGIELPVKPKP